MVRHVHPSGGGGSANGGGGNGGSGNGVASASNDESSSSSDDGAAYTLYLEHLGGFLPLLKGRKVSKIRPDFVIYDPSLSGKFLFAILWYVW